MNVGGSNGSKRAKQRHHKRSLDPGCDAFDDPDSILPKPKLKAEELQD